MAGYNRGSVRAIGAGPDGQSFTAAAGSGVMTGSPTIDRVLDRVQQEWQLVLDAGAAALVHGGEESIAVRVGHVVVRIGPSWRSSGDAEWCYNLADHLGVLCSEVVRPVRTPAGMTTVRVDGHPVSVWPWVDAVPGGAHHAQRQQAAMVLARLHRAAESISVPAPPPLRV